MTFDMVYVYAYMVMSRIVNEGGRLLMGNSEMHSNKGSGS